MLNLGPIFDKHDDLSHFPFYLNNAYIQHIYIRRYVQMYHELVSSSDHVVYINCFTSTSNVCVSDTIETHLSLKLRGICGIKLNALGKNRKNSHPS